MIPQKKSKNRICWLVVVLLLMVALTFGLLEVVKAPPEEPRYEFTDLGTLGGKDSGAIGINNKGQVVGSALTANAKSHAFIWSSADGIEDLQGLNDSFETEARGINEHGDVCGTIHGRAQVQLPFFWTAEGGFKELRNEDFKTVDEVALNNHGAVVGRGKDKSGKYCAIVWSSTGEVRKLDSLAGERSGAIAINDRNQVAGWVTDESGDPHAVLWDPEKGVVDLGSPPGNISLAQGINELGDVVGYVEDRNRVCTGALWTEGRITLLGTLRSGGETWAQGINNKKQIVGGEQSPGGNWPSPVRHFLVTLEQFTGINVRGPNRAFLWEEGQMFDLNDLISEDVDLHLIHARDINDRGQIVGECILDNGEWHAFLLSPVSNIPR